MARRLPGVGSARCGRGGILGPYPAGAAGVTCPGADMRVSLVFGGRTRRPGEGALDRGVGLLLRRAVPALAGLAVVAALAMVQTASGHPEECSTNAAWSNGNLSWSPYTTWEG